MSPPKGEGPSSERPTPQPTSTQDPSRSIHDVNDLAAAARHYIEVHQLELIPLRPSTKIPKIKTGVGHAKHAVTKTADIGWWWRTNRNGIAVSGRRNRLSAVDIDGPKGFEKLWELEKIHGVR